MGAFVKGDVVVTPFPFSDLSAAKKRPALVVAALTGDDVLLRQALIVCPDALSQYISPVLCGSLFRSPIRWSLSPSKKNTSRS